MMDWFDDNVGSVTAAILISPALLLAACTWDGHGCSRGVPRNWSPQVLKDDSGRRYYVEHHVGCAFAVRELDPAPSK